MKSFFKQFLKEGAPITDQALDNLLSKAANPNDFIKVSREHKLTQDQLHKVLQASARLKGKKPSTPEQQAFRKQLGLPPSKEVQ
jgi:hypothetical protein